MPTLKLDTVEGHVLDRSVGQGRIVRTGLIKDIILPLNFATPDALVQAFATLGMPQRGDRYPNPAYNDFFVKRHIFRALTATVISVNIIYEYLGYFTIKDSSTLSSVTTQIHPSGQPIYVQWKNPNDPNGATIKKVATMHSVLPLRHIVASKTIDHKASGGVLSGFGSVNSLPWNDLPPGFWLFSGLEGETLDEGVTYSYTTVFSTKMIEDWSQLEYIRDERGEAVPVDPTQVQNLKLKPYAYTVDQSVNGLTKVGMYPLLDFNIYFTGSRQ